MGFDIKGKKADFEKLKIDEWLTGEIKEVAHRFNADRKLKNDDGVMEARPTDEIRIAFVFDGYEYKHFSRWMTASTNKESNFYKKYLSKILPDKQPNCDINTDELVGKKVKVMWEENEYNGEVYQNVSQVRAL